MNSEETLLRWDLSITSEKGEARFIDKNDYLRLYSPDIYDYVEARFKDDHGLPFMNGEDRSVIFHAGEWVHAPLSREARLEGLLFVPDDGAWVCQHRGNTIRILASCDQRDAATWISSYLKTCSIPRTGSNLRGRIVESEGVTYELGTYVDKVPMAVASMHDSTISFLTHKQTNRLFCVGVEEVTKDDPTPTSIEDVVVHECVHLLRPQLLDKISTLTSLVTDGLRGNEDRYTELCKAAMTVNEMYFEGLFHDSKKEVETAPDDKLEDAINYNADRIANEMVTEFMSRCVLGGKKTNEVSRNPMARNICEELARVPLSFSLPINETGELHRYIYSTRHSPPDRLLGTAIER